MRSAVSRGFALAVVCGSAFWAGTGAADPVSGKEARKALFKAGAVEVELVPGILPADQAEVLKSVAVGQPYYGVIALSPDEGLLSEATVASANFHSIEAATVAALAGCDAKRKGKAPCVAVALIRPKGWAEGRAVQLSQEATEGFAKDYKGSGPMALAASVGTGVWAIAKGEGAAEAAVAACAQKNAEAGDCQVVIAD